MSVRPVTFNADGSVEAVYDEAGHSGTVPANQVVWVDVPPGGQDHNYLILPCPDGCGASSSHPVSGGADAPNVQQMFVNKTDHDGCACGQVASTDVIGLGEAHVRLNCNRMDGPGRWQLDQGVAAVVLQGAEVQASDNMFQVVYVDPGDGLIVGMNPSGGAVGSAHKVAVIQDLAEYDVLMRTNPAYLSADKNHILAAPEVAAAA